MRIIITGGSGFVGQALAEELVRDNHEVIVLSRNPEDRELPSGVRAAAWDAKTAQGWGELVEGAGAIVNLAGESIATSNLLKIRWTSKRKRRLLPSRQNAGQAVVEAVSQARQKPAVVVQASAVGYYGPRENVPLSEDAPPGDDFLANVVQQWERSTAAVESMGVRRAVIRSGLVLSDKGGMLPLQALPFKLFVGGPVASGKQGYPWIHLTDEIRAIRYLIDNPDGQGTFNLTAPETVTNADMGRTLAKVLHRPYYLPVPGFAFKLAFAGAANLITTGQMPVPDHLQAIRFEFSFPTIEAALRDIYG